MVEAMNVSPSPFSSLFPSSRSPPAAAAAAAAKRRGRRDSEGCSAAERAAVAAAETEEEKKEKNAPMLDGRRVSRRSLLVKFLTMALLFLLAAGGLVHFYFHLPGLSGETRAELAQLLPSSWSDSGKLRQLETVRGVFRVFSEYKAAHPWTTWLFLCCCYLLYQAFPFFTFTFPGTATMVTLLLGALYPTHVAFITANALAAIGPSAAYFMIWFVGKPLVSFLFADQLEKLSRILRTKNSMTKQQQQPQQQASSSSSRRPRSGGTSQSNGGTSGEEKVWGGVCVASDKEEEGSSRCRGQVAAAARSSSRGSRSGSSGSSVRDREGRDRGSRRSRGSGNKHSESSSNRRSSSCSSGEHQLLQQTEAFRTRTDVETRGQGSGREEGAGSGGERQQRSITVGDDMRTEEQQEEAAVREAEKGAVSCGAALPRLLKQGDEKKNTTQSETQEQQRQGEKEGEQKQQQQQQTDSRSWLWRKLPRKKSSRFDVDLFLTMLFLRVSPVFPNLVITAAAPLLEVPFDVFFYATLLGLMPNTAVFVSMGSALSSLDSLYGSWKLWGLLCVMGAAVLVLKLLRQRLGGIERAALEGKEEGEETLQREK